MRTSIARESILNRKDISNVDLSRIEREFDRIDGYDKEIGICLGLAERAYKRNTINRIEAEKAARPHRKAATKCIEKMTECLNEIKRILAKYDGQ